MANLSTTYMGMELRNPVVVAACSLSGKIDNVQRAEAAGAGALVIKSLFEEQILHEMGVFEKTLSSGSESFAESLTYFPKLEHAGAREHVMWVEKTRAAVKMPLMASLNAVHPGHWVSYARQLAGAGVDGLELNVYAVEANLDRSAEDVEQRMLDTFSAVKAATTLPIAVKLSPFYTSVGNVVKDLETRGASAVVMFNRFLQPDISVSDERLRHDVIFSREGEMKLPLRWLALLYGRVGLDLAANTGVYKAEDVVKYLLGGATIVQVASSLYKNGIEYLAELVKGLDQWMTAKGYADLSAFRGKVSQKNLKGDSFLFERAQYMDFLLQRKS